MSGLSRKRRTAPRRKRQSRLRRLAPYAWGQRLALLFAGLCLALAAQVCAGQVRDWQSVHITAAGDYFAAGGNVHLRSDVDGGNVCLDREVKGNIVATGGNIVLSGKAYDNVYLAGGTVSLQGPIAGCWAMSSLGPFSATGCSPWYGGARRPAGFYAYLRSSSPSPCLPGLPRSNTQAGRSWRRWCLGWGPSHCSSIAPTRAAHAIWQREETDNRMTARQL